MSAVSQLVERQLFLWRLRQRRDAARASASQHTIVQSEAEGEATASGGQDAGPRSGVRFSIPESDELAD